MGREPWLYHTVASPLEARSSRKWANIIYACLPKYVNMPPAFSFFFFFFNEERPAPLLFCPQVTLCGWQDVKIHLLTDSSSIIHSKFINIRACRAWRTLWTIYRDTPLPQHTHTHTRTHARTHAHTLTSHFPLPTHGSDWIRHKVDWQPI